MATPTTQEALIYVMVVMSAVDQSMTDRELARMGSLVRSLPVFNDYDEENILDAARRCQQILEKDDGLEEILEYVATEIPDRLHDTAYAVAVEIAAADLHVEQEELRFLQMLRDALGLDKLTVAAIERGAQARFRTAS